MLSVRGLRSKYGRIEVLHGVDIDVNAGEIVTVIGANGAGKTTLLRCLSGLQPAAAGSVVFQNQDITHTPAHRRPGLGLTQSPEGRQIFTNLSVEENLRLGAFNYADDKVEKDMEDMFVMFPALRPKRSHNAGGLSGGQQQMLAVARALMGRPACLLLDEPSMGLAPILAAQILDAVKGLRERGVTALLVEQNVSAALAAADRGYVMEVGRIAVSGSARELSEDPRVREAYLGLS